MSPPSVWAADIDLNDISILLPLPQTVDDSNLLAPITQASYGPLIPESYYSLASADGQQVVGISPAEPDFKILRVVGVRIDPCFSSLDFANPSACQPQIRLIWQDLRPSGLEPGRPQISADDTTVHTFYDLNPGELASLMDQIQRLKKTSGLDIAGLPLGIHPIIFMQGLSGNYWQGLRTALLTLIGGSRLTRITFALSTGFSGWIFKGYDIVNGRAQPLLIAETGGYFQKFSTSFVAEGFFGPATPSPSGTDTFNELLTNSSQFIKTNANNDQAQVDTLNSVLRVENPKFNSSATVDCVSCHAAQAAHLLLSKSFPGLNSTNSNGFSSSFNLTNNSANAGSTGVLRAFGYFNSDAAISQRCINETATIARFLSSQGRP
jgi:hypothetical protein